MAVNTEQETIRDKNIQLSEKLEYLMTVGNLVLLTTERNQTRFLYLSVKLGIDEVQTGGRMLDFVNNIVDSKGIYPLVQKFHSNKKI